MGVHKVGEEVGTTEVLDKTCSITSLTFSLTLREHLSGFN